MAYRRKSTRILTGIDEIDTVLMMMKTAGANRAARAGLSAGCRVGVKAVKKLVPSTMKDAKKVTGFSVKTQRGGPSNGLCVSKYGLGVGQKRGPKVPPSRGKRKGVGIGARNIHWFALGTKERFIKNGGKSGFPLPGHPTGRMMKDGTAPLNGAVQKAWASAGSQILDTVKRKTLEQIDREVAKAMRKGG